MEASLYDAVGGRAGLLALARAWHVRCLADPVAAHPFEHGVHPQHVERLAAYWGEALGGPGEYSDTMGDQSGVERIHAGNGEHRELDERAIACFVAAMDDADLPEDPRLRAELEAWFRWSTGLMAAHPDSPDDVPDGLPVPRWSWDGLVER